MSTSALSEHTRTMSPRVVRPRSPVKENVDRRVGMGVGPGPSGVAVLLPQPGLDLVVEGFPEEDQRRDRRDGEDRDVLDLPVRDRLRDLLDRPLDLGSPPSTSTWIRRLTRQFAFELPAAAALDESQVAVREQGLGDLPSRRDCVAPANIRAHAG